MNRRTNETRTTTGTRFLFTGRKWLAPLGLYDYRNRTYSPTLGRFLQTDSIRFHAGDVNLYRYVGNNSLFWRDPYGLCPGCGSKSIDWGSGGASKGNCWRYACDDPMKPGEEHSPFPRGKDPGGHVTCDQVIAGTKAKGATDPEKGGCCPKGFRLIKAVIQDKTKPGWNDYHWYRYEGGGKWTHKPGSGKVEETKDPTKDAADRGYDKDCGNLCVHENADVD
jgi:RHS repeat-associated protein